MFGWGRRVLVDRCLRTDDDVEAGEIILDPSDHLEVGVTAGGVESDQPRENIVAKQI